MPQLIVYLRRLVDKCVATKDHVTLLFTSLIKTAERDPKKLNEFIDIVVAAIDVVEKNSTSSTSSNSSGNSSSGARGNSSSRERNISKKRTDATATATASTSASLEYSIAATSGKSEKENNNKLLFEEVLTSAVAVDEVIAMLDKAQLKGNVM